MPHMGLLRVDEWTSDPRRWADFNFLNQLSQRVVRSQRSHTVSKACADQIYASGFGSDISGPETGTEAETLRTQTTMHFATIIMLPNETDSVPRIRTNVYEGSNSEIC